MLTAKLPLDFMDWLKVLLVLPEVMVEMSGPFQLQSLFPLLIARDLSRPAGLPDKEIQIVPITGCAVLMGALIHVETSPKLRVRHKPSL
jgi:hypothetical protein